MKKPEKLDLPPPVSPQQTSPELASIDKKIPFKIQLGVIGDSANQQVENQITSHKKGFIKEIQQIRNSRLVVYYSPGMIDHEDFQNFYDVVQSIGPCDNLDLFLLSSGGYAGPAFKMARLCQAVAKKKFSVLIPFYAKSAATILSLGSDEIVMGPTSELGPIDPQINITDDQGLTKSVPALSLREALEFIKKEVEVNPRRATIYAPLLARIDLMTLGHYDREISSATQYAIELLTSRKINKIGIDDAKSIAGKLTEYYKTHGFVIDTKEAGKMLGSTVVEAPERLWLNMWNLHNTYDFILRRKGYSWSFIETHEMTLERDLKKR